jgi:hypothetical protein
MSVEFNTPKALRLSSIIRLRMGEYFKKYTLPNSDIYNVFSASSATDVIPRTNGILGHFSVAYGIQEYVNNYCNISLTANGYAQGTEIAFANKEVSTVGLIGSLDIDYFPLFMMPMTLQPTNEEYLTDQLEATKKFFRSILLWFSTPFLTSKTHYCDDKFYFDTDLNFGFGLAYDEIDNIATEVVNKMNENKNQMTMKLAWDIMSAGIITVLNLNELYSTQVDTGIGAIYTGTLLVGVPLIPPYFGYTEGVATFASDYYLNLDFKVLAGTLGIPDMKFPVQSKIIPNFSTITYTDISTQKIESIDVNYLVSRIDGGVSDILDNVEISVKQAINRESDFLYRKLKAESSLTDIEITLEIIKVMKTLEPMVNNTADYLLDNISNYLENCAKLMTRVSRIIAWMIGIKTILPYGYLIYLEDILQDFIDAITEINDSLSNIVTSVDGAVSNFGKVGTGSLNDIIETQKVNLGVQLKYFSDSENIFSFDEVNEDYAQIAAFVLLIGNIVKLVAESTKVSNIVAQTTATTLLATTKTANETAKNTPATAASFQANQVAYNLLKTVTPLPQSDVSTTDPDYAIQSAITEVINTAFTIYANGKKTSISAEVITIDPDEILEKLQSGQGVYEI